MFTCLNLNDRKRHINEDIKCNLCGHIKEDLAHFLLHCPKLESERSKINRLQRPRIEDENLVIGEILFNDEKTEAANLYRMWLKRKSLSDSNN